MVVGVKYGSDIDKVKELLTKIAEEHPQVRKKPEPRILLRNFGDNSLDFEIRCFIRNIRNRRSVASDIRSEIYKIFNKHNIEIPFPQRDVHIIDKKKK